MYEAVRSDRNHYSKGLIESQDEIAELRKKFKIMGHQIEQLKEEIAAKDQALVKEHFEVQRAESLKEAMQGELNLKNQISKRNEELVRQQEIELKKLAVRYSSSHPPTPLFLCLFYRCLSVVSHDLDLNADLFIIVNAFLSC